MLKITIFKSGAAQRLIVEGKLAEPCISELERAWNQARQGGGSRPILVDLSEVTSIDPRGKALLERLIGEGARLTARGLYCEYIARRLMKRVRKKQEGAADSKSTKESNSVSQCLANKET